MVATAACGYKATRWDDPFQVRLCLLKRTSEPITAAHNDLSVGYVSFEIRKRTIAATTVNDRFGSIRAFDWNKI
jgi:hypothetical protein